MINGCKRQWLFLALAGWLPLASAAADRPEAADTCADCHGEQGVSNDQAVPTIAGASAFFLENQLVIYKEEARPCAEEEFAEEEHDVEAADHCALAKELSEARVTELADWFSAQPFKPADQPVDGALAGKGKSVHERHCDKCHTDGGSLALDDAGILAGQWKPYLLEQLKHYKQGSRWQPEKMKPAIKAISEENMKALVEYYASQGAERF